MDKLEIEIKRIKITINGIAEKLQSVSHTIIVNKEELLQKFAAKDVINNKMVTVAGQMFIEYEKKIDSSFQIIKQYEDSIGDHKIKNNMIDKV